MPRDKSVYELAEEVGGMYALVVAAAKRAKQLKEGRHPVTQCASSNPLTVAIQELLERKVTVRPPGEKEGPAELVEETEAGSAGAAEASEAPAAEDDPAPGDAPADEE